MILINEWQKCADCVVTGQIEQFFKIETTHTFLPPTWAIEMYAVQQGVYPPAFTVSIPVLYSCLSSPSQVTCPASWGHIAVQHDGGDTLSIQSAVGHMQGEDVGVIVVKDALSQHQIHAVTSCSGGGGVQDQSLVLQRHGAPALKDRQRDHILVGKTGLRNSSTCFCG